MLQIVEQRYICPRDRTRELKRARYKLSIRVAVDTAEVIQRLNLITSGSPPPRSLAVVVKVTALVLLPLRILIPQSIKASNNAILCRNFCMDDQFFLSAKRKKN